MESNEIKVNPTANEDENGILTEIKRFYENTMDQIKESLAAVEEFSPWWFDLVPFLVLMLSYESILHYGDRSYLLLVCTSYPSYCIIENLDLKNVSKRIILTNKPNSQQTANNHGEGANPPKEVNFVTRIIMSFAIGYVLYNLPEQMVRFSIFAYCCRRVLRAPFKPDWRKITQSFVFDAINKINAPEQELNRLATDGFKKLWIFAEFPLRKFIETKISTELQSKLGLTSCQIMNIAQTTDSFSIAGVKVHYKGEEKVEFDINVMYNAKYTSIAKWPSGDVFNFHSLQLDAKFRVELFTLANLIPSGIRMILSMSEFLKDAEKVTITLKKINKIETSNDDITGDVKIKRRYLKGLEEVLYNQFPVVHNLGERSSNGDFMDRIKQENKNAKNARHAASEAAAAAAVRAINAQQSGAPQQTQSHASSIRTPLAKIATIPQSPMQLSQVSGGSIIQRHRPTSTISDLVDTGNRISATTQQPVRESLHEPSAPSFNNGVSSHDLDAKSLSSVESAVSSAGSSSTSELGKLDLTVLLEPQRVLLVTVHQLRNLPSSKGRTPNPYVKLSLLASGEDHKNATDILEKTADPVFEKSFRFQLAKSLTEYKLHVVVRTKHLLHHSIGQVVLSFSPTSNRDVEERRWYPLRPHKNDSHVERVEYRPPSLY